MLSGKRVTCSPNMLVPPALFVSGTTTFSFKKPQVHGYSQFLRLFSKTSTGYSPKHFTSFGYYVKTLAKKKKKRCFKKWYKQKTLIQSIGFSVHWALPMRRKAVPWSSDLDCLDSYSLTIHSDCNSMSLPLWACSSEECPVSKEKRRASSFSSCKAGFNLADLKLRILQITDHFNNSILAKNKTKQRKKKANNK